MTCCHGRTGRAAHHRSEAVLPAPDPAMLVPDPLVWPSALPARDKNHRLALTRAPRHELLGHQRFGAAAPVYLRRWAVKLLSLSSHIVPSRAATTSYTKSCPRCRHLPSGLCSSASSGGGWENGGGGGGRDRRWLGFHVSRPLEGGAGQISFTFS